MLVSFAHKDWNSTQGSSQRLVGDIRERARGRAGQRSHARPKRCNGSHCTFRKSDIVRFVLSQSRLISWGMKAGVKRTPASYPETCCGRRLCSAEHCVCIFTT